MKLLLLAVVVALSHCCYGQSSKKTSPFQVLYAERAKNKAGVEVHNLDRIDADEVLTIADSGTLSLIHISGFPIQIDNDTTIDVQGTWGDVSFVR
jgi:hypothetical protein